MPSGRAIGVVSRAPTPGNVKSRLAEDISPETAASLYAAFLRDVLVAAAAIPNASVTVFHPVNDDERAILELCPPGVIVQSESGRGYGKILPNALRAMLQHANIAALLGADSPGLPDATIRSAIGALEAGKADVAICPTADGGFCLLAVNGDYPGLFQQIDWNTERVFEQVFANAERLELRVSILPEWYDVDNLEDLERLAADLAGDVNIGAAATRAALRRLRQSGVAVPSGQSPWRVDDRRTIFETPWRTMVSDRITTHAGEVIEYAYLETESAVWVIPVTGDGRIVLVRQYRHPIREIILEVPAGAGTDDPLEVAARELREETGGRAREMIHISTFFPASAHVTHEGHVVLALGVEFGETELESTELLDTSTVPADLAFQMARSGEIADSQSALAILSAEPAIRNALDPR